MASAERLMLTKGFAATTVDEICDAADLTKGAFFHYFASKDAVGKATVERFALNLVRAFQGGAFHEKSDPLERIDGYIDFTAELCESAILQHGCLVGAFSVELAETHPEIRAVCGETFTGWAQGLSHELEAARARYAPDAAVDTQRLANHFIAVLEGALLLAKARQDPQVIAENLEHFRRYVRSLFGGSLEREDAA